MTHEPRSIPRSSHPLTPERRAPRSNETNRGEWSSDRATRRAVYQTDRVPQTTTRERRHGQASITSYTSKYPNIIVTGGMDAFLRRPSRPPSQSPPQSISDDAAASFPHVSSWTLVSATTIGAAADTIPTARAGRADGTEEVDARRTLPVAWLRGALQLAGVVGLGDRPERGARGAEDEVER